MARDEHGIDQQLGLQLRRGLRVPADARRPGLAFTFTIFAVICLGGIVFTLTRVPETTGHSLEAIEAYLESGKPLVALGAAKT